MKYKLMTPQIITVYNDMKIIIMLILLMIFMKNWPE